MTGRAARRGRPGWLVGARIAFALYAVALAVGTHWPRFQAPGPPGVSDKGLHFAAFFGWGLLLTACAAFGPVRSTRNVLLAWAIGSAYGVVDEVTQALPGLQREVSALDALMNLLGVAAAAALVLMVREAAKGGRDGIST